MRESVRVEGGRGGVGGLRIGASMLPLEVHRAEYSPDPEDDLLAVLEPRYDFVNWICVQGYRASHTHVIYTQQISQISQ